MSIYVTLGIFLLLAVRDPAANRSLIAFAGWANLAHAAVMAAQEYRNVIERRELAGVVVFAIVGVVLVVLAPAHGVFARGDLRDSRGQPFRPRCQSR
jgi:hypothetical protein